MPIFRQSNPNSPVSEGTAPSPEPGGDCHLDSVRQYGRLCYGCGLGESCGPPPRASRARVSMTAVSNSANTRCRFRGRTYFVRGDGSLSRDGRHARRSDSARRHRGSCRIGAPLQSIRYFHISPNDLLTVHFSRRWQGGRNSRQPENICAGDVAQTSVCSARSISTFPFWRRTSPQGKSGRHKMFAPGRGAHSTLRHCKSRRGDSGRVLESQPHVVCREVIPARTEANK